MPWLKGHSGSHGEKFLSSVNGKTCERSSVGLAGKSITSDVYRLVVGCKQDSHVTTWTAGPLVVNAYVLGLLPRFRLSTQDSKALSSYSTRTVYWPRSDVNLLLRSINRHVRHDIALSRLIPLVKGGDATMMANDGQTSNSDTPSHTSSLMVKRSSFTHIMKGTSS
jgi:hypothetical protein